MMRTLLLVLTVLVLAPSPAGGAAPDDQVLAFADHLFSKGDYYRAITEYERFLFLSPGHQRVRYARYQIARCYFEGDKLSTAIQLLRELIAGSTADEDGLNALHLLADSYYRRQEYERARETYAEFLQRAPGDPRADAVRIRIGWTYLREGDWQQAGAQFESIPEGSSLLEQAAGLAEEAKTYPDIPSKSPALAGWMSAILPGAGQLYIERPRDATVSFLLNGLFIWATAEQFRKDNHVTGGILLFFETGWYVGNIYNAVGGAHKYNRRAKAGFLDGLEQRYRISYLQERNGSHVLALTVPF
jgi:TM2 domain-containing membrane protein YozV